MWRPELGLTVFASVVVSADRKVRSVRVIMRRRSRVASERRLKFLPLALSGGGVVLVGCQPPFAWPARDGSWKNCANTPVLKLSGLTVTLPENG